jgi:hypothetical protein
MGFLLVVEIGGSPQLLDSRKKPAILSKAPEKRYFASSRRFFKKRTLASPTFFVMRRDNSAKTGAAFFQSYAQLFF